MYENNTSPFDADLARTPDLKLVALVVLWIIGVGASIYLLYLCLSVERLYANEIIAAPTTQPSTQPAAGDLLLGELQKLKASVDVDNTRLAVIEARFGDLDKRIAEASNHATQVLSVIGFLMGVFSLLIAIGLWHSKEYIDRVVSGAKQTLKDAIALETSDQMQRLSDQVVKQEQKVADIDGRGAAILASLADFDAEARNRLRSKGNEMAVGLRQVTKTTFEEILGAFRQGLAVSAASGIIDQAKTEELTKGLENYIWMRGQLLRALLFLNADSSEEVLTGCQLLSAVGDREHLQALERMRPKWVDEPRVLQQIQMTYERLSKTSSTTTEESG